MRDINLIVIHCSATIEGVDYSVAAIRRWHIARGFKDIGYHFIVHLDGRIERGRPWDIAGAHARGYNGNSIGVCYIGGLDANGDSKDTRTVAQIYALRALSSSFTAMFPTIKIVGHRDLSVDLNGDGAISKDEWMKDCPCFDISEI